MIRFKKRRLIFSLALALLLGLGAGAGSTLAQSVKSSPGLSGTSDNKSSSSENMILDAEDDEFQDLDEDVLDIDDSTDDETIDGERPATLKPDTQPSWFRSLWEPARFSLQYELGLGIEPSARIVVNRPSLRLEWERLLGENYFLRFDGLAEIMLPNDHRTRALSNKDYLVEGKLREFYLQTSRGDLSLKIGKQIVIWGEAEGSAVTDVISPRDLSEFLFTSLENSRLGQIMVTGDYFSKWGRWTLMLNPDPKSNRFPDPGTEYAFPSLADQPGIRVLEEPLKLSLRDLEIGLRWWTSLGSTDISIMAANLLSNDPAFKFEGPDAFGRMVFRTVYPRYYMAGLAFNHSRGNFLWKGEVAVKTGRCFSTADPLDPDGLADLDSIQAALALEYDASGAYQVYLEASNQYLLNWTGAISGVRRNESAFVAIWSKSFLNETLKASYTFGLKLQDKDIFNQLKLRYDLNDHLNVQFDLTLLFPRDRQSALGFLGDKDRVTFTLKYYF